MVGRIETNLWAYNFLYVREQAIESAERLASRGINGSPHFKGVHSNTSTMDSKRDSFIDDFNSTMDNFIEESIAIIRCY
jgi:hypothetical protein